ncbi:hypothetical protein FRC03_005188 [Tulasnella sp. 419]|nr:hypothetical protein FRC03_005188 [Tulasnella sp. 419]
MSAEAKLQKLKVTDLKAILTKASLPVSGVKAELVSRILASPAAIKAAGLEEESTNAPVNAGKAADADMAEYDASPTPDVPSQPAATTAPVSSPPKQSEAPTTSAEPAAASSTQTDTATSTPKISELKLENEATVDPELERKRARAARFGIPVVEAKKPPPPKAQKAAPPASKGSTSKTSAAAPAAPSKSQGPADDLEKMKTRAARFGIPLKAQESKEPSASKPSSSSAAAPAPGPALPLPNLRRPQKLLLQPPPS